MANVEHLEILKKGVEEWNNWRKENPLIQPNLAKIDLSHEMLSGFDFSNSDFSNSILVGVDFSTSNLSASNLFRANLFRANLSEAMLMAVDFTKANLSKAKFLDAYGIAANFSGANFTEAILINSNFEEANLSNTKLTGAYLLNAKLSNADFSNADLSGADFSNADFSKTNLTGANLTRTNLTKTTFLETIVEKTRINNCNIYGINVWNCKGELAEQKDLIITPDFQPEITVDNIKIAQFIYLLLENKEIRNVIDTLTSKAVLILGRFTAERKAVLDAIKNELRRRNYLPILFDFDKPASRDLTETIKTLASISRFVIADITDAKSIPQELSHIVPHLPSLAVVPIILESQRQYAMFEHFERYPWVLPLYTYSSKKDLLKLLNEKVINPAERKVEELRR